MLELKAVCKGREMWGALFSCRQFCRANSKLCCKVWPVTQGENLVSPYVINVFFLFTFPKSISFLLIYYPIFILVQIIAAIGLLMLKEWGRKLTLIIIWLGLIVGVIISLVIPEIASSSTGAYYQLILMSAIMALITVIFTWYLRKDHVRMAFKD